MTPTTLINYLQFAITNRFPVLITGAPGIGKSDIVTQAAKAAGAYLKIMHPVVSDPTDFKGLPFEVNGQAHFLPYANLKEMMEAKELMVVCFDDLGQSPATIQAAVMQLLLAREVDGKPISPFVTFIAATNRKEDKAGVTGILEPVKSRFASIVELEVSTEDWIKWALANNMPVELIAFIKFRPELLQNFQASRDMVNSPSPRTVANVGRQQANGLPPTLYFEVFKGAAGQAFAAEYCGFLQIFKELPTVDSIILDPAGARVPTGPAALHAVSTALASKAKEDNIDAVVQYLNRLPGEFAVSCMKDAVTRNPQLTNTKGFISWAADKGNVIL